MRSDDWIGRQLISVFSDLDIYVTQVDLLDNNLKTVDLLARYQGETWLIEYKDPEGTPLPQRQDKTADMWGKLRSGAILKESLLPKLYGTYVCLIMNDSMKRGKVRYHFIIGLSDLDAITRTTLSDSAQRIIDRIGPKLRHSRHTPVVEVHNLASWNAAHPDMPIIRHP